MRRARRRRSRSRSWSSASTSAIAAFRAARGFPTRTSIARASGVGVVSCFKVESGRRVSRDTLARYGEPLGLSADQVANLRPADLGGDGGGQLLAWAVRPVTMAAETWRTLDLIAAPGGALVDHLVERLVLRGLDATREESA